MPRLEDKYYWRADDIPPKLQPFYQGYNKVSGHKLLGELSGTVYMKPNREYGHSGIATVDKYGKIHVNPYIQITSDELAYVLAHCLLHLAIKALSTPPIPWEVELGNWFDINFPPLEKHRTYARPSRRQGATPDIPRPRYVLMEEDKLSRTFGVVIDTSGSMSTKQIGLALGAIASYAVSKDVPLVRVIFCDADAYDASYMTPYDIAGKVKIIGRGGTVLQPAITLLEKAKDFPKDGPILIITDGYIENRISIHREHAYLLPKGNKLPFNPKGKVFYFK